MSARYTPEFRGGDLSDNDWEWCIIDEHVTPCGGMIKGGMTKSQAIQIAAIMNELGVDSFEAAEALANEVNSTKRALDRGMWRVKGYHDYDQHAVKGRFTLHGWATVEEKLQRDIDEEGCGAAFAAMKYNWQQERLQL